MEDRTDSLKLLENEKKSNNPILFKLCSCVKPQISKTKISGPSSTATHAAREGATRDHVYNHPPVIKNQYLFSKARQKRRRQREEAEAKNIKAALSSPNKSQDVDNIESTRWKAHPPPEYFNESEDEYETILKEVRELKEKIQNEKKDPEDEYEKIIREVRELKTKIRRMRSAENANAKKNPEDEYETVLREVRELKKKRHNAKKYSTESLAIVPKKPVKSVHFKENEMERNVTNGYEIIEEIYVDGEIVGEVDEHSIIIDLGTDAHSLNLNEEFPGLGLIDE